MQITITLSPQEAELVFNCVCSVHDHMLMLDKGCGNKRKHLEYRMEMESLIKKLDERRPKHNKR